MSPEMKHALKVAKLCEEQLSELRHRAIQGDLPSALILADVATKASRAVQDLWFEPGIYNPFRSKSSLAGLEMRREALAYWLSSKASMPVLISLDECIDPDGATMLRGIRTGPFKPRDRKPSDMKTLIEAIVLPSFQTIQMSPNRPSSIEGRIWDLPPLSKASLPAWSDLIIDWLWEKHRDPLNTPTSWLYRLARPEYGLKAEQRKRRATLKRNRAKWRRDGGGEMSPVTATKAEHSAKEITNMRVTHAHIRNGLKTAITGYLRRNLAA